jgi:hypothetical protein
MSKGSKQRPVEDKKKFESEWDRIFNKPQDKPKDKKDASSKG